MDHEAVGDDGRCRHWHCSPHHKGPCHSLSLPTPHRRKMGEGLKNNLACGKCTMFGTWAKEQPYLCTSSGSLAETEPQIFQWGYSQRGMQPVWLWGQNSSPGFWQGGNTWVARSQRNARPQRQQPPHKNPQPKERRPIHNKKTTHKTCIWWTTIISPSLHNYIIKWDHCGILYHQFIQHQHPVPVQVAQDRIHNYFPVQPPVAAFPLSRTMCDSLSHKVDPNSLFKIIHFQLLLNFYKSKFPSFGIPFTSKFHTKLVCKFVSF